MNVQIKDSIRQRWIERTVTSISICYKKNYSVDMIAAWQNLISQIIQRYYGYVESVSTRAGIEERFLAVLVENFLLNPTDDGVWYLAPDFAARTNLCERELRTLFRWFESIDVVIDIDRQDTQSGGEEGTYPSMFAEV